MEGILISIRGDTVTININGSATVIKSLNDFKGDTKDEIRKEIIAGMESVDG